MRRTYAIVFLVLFYVTDALARVGGGQHFSSGGGGGFSGGSHSFSGGGSGGGEGIDITPLIYLLIWAVREHPFLSWPIILFILYRLYIHQRSLSSNLSLVSSHSGPATGRSRKQPNLRENLQALTQRDPAFSEPVLHDFLQLVLRRAHEAVGSGEWDLLRPFLSIGAQASMQGYDQGVSQITDVVLASSTIVRLDAKPDRDVLTIEACLSRTETRADNRHVDVYIEEQWSFSRNTGVLSLTPEAVHRMGCPNCGAAVQCDPMGRCTSCGSSITHGEYQWYATSYHRTTRRQITPPDTELTQGGAEPGVSMRTIIDPDFGTAMREMLGRHPDFDKAALEKRISDIFFSLQAAWSATRWDDARPYCTDPVWNMLRFWLIGQAKAGQRNRIEDVQIQRIVPVHIATDAWYESITVRIWASARDWTELVSNGKVVGGNKTHAREFSEYWTFIRAVGAQPNEHDIHHCPSCGAPVEHINATGACEYCESIITLGNFDWVLSRIEQPEVYRG